MKKKSVFVAGLIMFGSLTTHAQQWAGSTTTTGDIYRTGRVGIGTSSPVTQLNVVTGSTNDGVRIQQTGTTASSLGLFNNSGRNWAIFSTGSGNAEGAGNLGFYDYSGGGYRMFLQGSSGNLGLGTITPEAKLHVHQGILKLTGPNGAGGPMMVLGGTPSVAPYGEWGIEYTTSTPGREGLNFWKPFLASGVTGNNFLFLANSGRVGVNTDNPTAQLTVNGNMLIGDPATVCIPNTNYKLFVQTGILTEKVRVAVNCSANWADYVFASDYKLMPLTDLEKFVTENKHLPNIPSAEEVVKDGVDVGQMTSKLLEKVEELSLYIIEQNKKIEALEKDIESLKK
jgi:hypothetical protein